MLGGESLAEGIKSPNLFVLHQHNPTFYLVTFSENSFKFIQFSLNKIISLARLSPTNTDFPLGQTFATRGANPS